MIKVVYEVVPHDGGWAYRLGGVYSEAFPTHAEALEAARIVAAEQQVGGDSAEISWLLRVGLNRSGVTVWAFAAVPGKAINARHDKTARKAVARPVRPHAGPAITMKILQQRQILAGRLPNGAENVVNGVKTIMVNDPLRTGPRVAPPNRPW
jgi:hypothetical protein